MYVYSSIWSHVNVVSLYECLQTKLLLFDIRNIEKYTSIALFF